MLMTLLVPASQYQKAKLLSLFSTEAEYLALFEASKTIMWLRQFLSELGFSPSSPTIIYEDNKSAINIIHNSYDKGRTKPMDIRHHNLRELVKDHHLSFTYCPRSLGYLDQTT